VFQFQYKADSNQMSFLQLLSSAAYQKLTYHCKNSVAVFDANNRNFRNSMRIMTTSDFELNARGNRKVRYSVVEDGCKVRFLLQMRANENYKVNIECFTN